jgi:acyl carrier protein
LLPTDQRLLKCFQVVFPGLNEGQIRVASVDSVQAWDSLATVKLFSLVEEEFGVVLDFEDLPEMTSFSRFASRVGGAA